MSTFTYRLYHFIDGNGQSYFQTKRQWGPFWCWIRCCYGHDTWIIAKWNTRDEAIAAIKCHANERRDKQRNVKIVEEIQA